MLAGNCCRGALDVGEKRLVQRAAGVRGLAVGEIDEMLKIPRAVLIVFMANGRLNQHAVGDAPRVQRRLEAAIPRAQAAGQIQRRRAFGRKRHGKKKAVRNAACMLGGDIFDDFVFVFRKQGND